MRHLRGREGSDVEGEDDKTAPPPATLGDDAMVASRYAATDLVDQHSISNL